MKENEREELRSPIFKKRFARRQTTNRPFTFVRNFERQAETQNQIVEQQVGERGVVITSSVPLQAAGDGTTITDIVRQSPVPVVIAYTAPESTGQTESREVEDDETQNFCTTPRRSNRSHLPSAKFLSRRQYPIGTPQHLQRAPDDQYIGSQNSNNIDEEVSFADQEEVSVSSKKKTSKASGSGKQSGAKAGVDKSITKGSAVSVKTPNETAHKSILNSSSKSAKSVKASAGKSATRGSASAAAKTTKRTVEKSVIDDTSLSEKAAGNELQSSMLKSTSTSKQSQSGQTPSCHEPQVTQVPISAAKKTSGRKQNDVDSSLSASKRSGKQQAVTETPAVLRKKPESVKRSGKAAENQETPKNEVLEGSRSSSAKSKRAKDVFDSDDGVSAKRRGGGEDKGTPAGGTFASSTSSNLEVSKRGNKTKNTSRQTAVSTGSATSASRTGKQQKVKKTSEAAKSNQQQSAHDKRSCAFSQSSVSSVGSGWKRPATSEEDRPEHRPSTQKKPRSGKKTVLEPSRKMTQIREATMNGNKTSQPPKSQSQLLSEDSDSQTSPSQKSGPVSSQPEGSATLKRFFTNRDQDKRLSKSQMPSAKRKVAPRKPGKDRSETSSSGKVMSRRDQQSMDVSVSSVYDDETFGRQDELLSDQTTDGTSTSGNKEGSYPRTQQQIQKGLAAAAELEKQSQSRGSSSVTEADVIIDMLEETEEDILDDEELSKISQSTVHKGFRFVKKQIQQTMQQTAEVRELASAVNKLKGGLRAVTRESRGNHQQKCILLKEVHSLKQHGVDEDMLLINTWLQDFTALRQQCSTATP